MKKYILLLVLMLNLVPKIKDGHLMVSIAGVSAQRYTEETDEKSGLCVFMYDDGSSILASEPCDEVPVFEDDHRCRYCSQEYTLAEGHTCTCQCTECGEYYTCQNGHDCGSSGSSGSSGAGGAIKGGGTGGGVYTPSIKPRVNLLSLSNWRIQAPNKCLTACEDYLRRVGLSQVGSRSSVYRLTYQDALGLHSYGSASSSFNKVVEVIDRHLSEGRGITVGLDYRSNSSNADGTDHFVVITGRGYDSSTGQYYYTYMDPGRGNASLGCDSDANRLYSDPSSNSIHGERQGKENTLTHIRPNDGNCSGSTTY